MTDRALQELAELMTYANAAVSYQEAVQTSPPQLDYSTTQHVAHDEKDMSGIRCVWLKSRSVFPESGAFNQDTL